MEYEMDKMNTETTEIQGIGCHIRNVADTPIENTAPLTVPEHGSAFINIDDDTDSDKDFRSDLNGMRSPPVSKNIYRISSASAKSINDTSPSILALELPTHALIQLKKWIESPTSNTIWIEGTLPFSYRSRNNLPRWKYYQNTTSPPPRCIFASCDLRHIFRTELRPHESESNEEFALLSLLDSIIAQLQGIFPSLSFSKPELLDRSTKSIDVALKMIWTFLEQDKVPSLIWIIDGLQFTESESTNPSVIELVYNLRVRGYKVCFTTQGASEVLSEVTSEYERVNALIAIGRNEGSR